MTSSSWWLLIAGITAAACFFGSQFPQKLAESKTIERPLLAIIAPERIIRLKIPVIGIDATLRPIGVTSAGAMGAPESPADVVWFEPGPRPGEVGSSVIAGHFGWKDDVPAVFDGLTELIKGDKIYIKDGESEPIAFIVRDIRTYGEKDDTSDIFLSTDEKAHLNLITCFGSWDKKGESYSDRLVVFADKEI